MAYGVMRQIARLTRLVRSISGSNVVQATIIEHEKPAEPLEKIKEHTPAEGGGKEEGEAPKQEEQKDKKKGKKGKKDEEGAPPSDGAKPAEKGDDADKTGEEGGGGGGDAGDDADGDGAAQASPMPHMHFVTMQYPYGMYIGQAVPDQRLMCPIPHGHGKFFYNDGATYDGTWDRGNWEGTAIRTWPLGARYEGEFKDNLQHGQGTLVLPNGGGGYSGEWKDGFQHGKGILTTPDGSTCEGDFVEGDPHGKGIMRTPQGMVYEGEFENGLPHGKGITIYLDGTKYEGEFHDGEMHGEGVMFDADGNELRKGQWAHDEEVTS